MKETLTSRLVDRPIRPLFPEWFHDEVQIQSFVVASDRQNDADVLAMNGASAALGLSPLPFQGPIALGPPGPDRWPVRALPHARRPGGERSRPDRLGQQRGRADDRGLCPRNARGRDARGDPRQPRATSSEICELQKELFRKVERREEAVRDSRPPTACTSGCTARTTPTSRRPSRPRASTPGPTPWRRSRSGSWPN